ncbi:hypothetical protein N9R65_03095 [Opitutales bacterium]|nr:hypothetical protein [Opitutales bacterium]MDB2682518.1 hypothetical protein [Opitutales bacterium]
MMQNKRLFGYLSLVCLLLSPVSAKEIRVSPGALSQWSFYGGGFVAVDAQQQHTVLAETPGSKGVMLVSPASYDGDLVVSYKIRPLTPESVLVAMLSVSDRGADATLHLPEDYDGNMGYLTTDTDNYFVAFHNAAHNASPFIRRYSEATVGREQLVLAESNSMTTEWHTVEVGKQNGRLWLKVDGAIIIEASDPAALEAGRFIFRMRGTSERIGVCLIKDLRIDLVD